MIQARSPAKCILSGEHAVVYGAPALVAAVDKYAEISLKLCNEDIYRLELPAWSESCEVSAAELDDIVNRIDQRLAAFRSGELAVDGLLDHPAQFFLYGLAQARRAASGVPQGCLLTLTLGYPAGSGLGSSAAAACALVTACNKAYSCGWDTEQLHAQALACETLIHGTPSGVDTHVCLHGGLIRFQQGQATRLDVEKLQQRLVFTGTPTSSTGACVAAAAPLLRDDEPRRAAFAAVTAAMQQSLEQHDNAGFRTAVRENHRLLKELGVVPEAVIRFIEDIESGGGAAKICGAGAVSGTAAGMVLVNTDEDLVPLSRMYGYREMLVDLEHDGTILI